MPPTAALILTVVVAATLVLAVTMVIVIAGIRREERDVSMIRRSAPSPAAWLTRRIVGLYVRKTDSDICPDREIRRYQNCR